MEASFEGGQGPEGAVAPYMDGWKSHALLGVINANVPVFFVSFHRSGYNSVGDISMKYSWVTVSLVQIGALNFVLHVGF
jgi:hypothetical protein